MTGVLDWLSDNLIELQGPVDVANDAAMSTIATTATCEAKLYDTAYDGRIAAFTTILSADALAAATTIYVADALPATVGSTIRVYVDDGTPNELTVLTVNTVTGEITFASGLTDDAASGNKVTVVTYGGATSVRFPVDNLGVWTGGENMEITLDDGTTAEKTVSAYFDPDDGYVRVTAFVGSDFSAGNIIKRKIGADITNFADFGTFPSSDPVAGDPTWGYRGTIAHDHADLALGMRVRAEITAVDGTLNLTRKAIATVINR